MTNRRFLVIVAASVAAAAIALALGGLLHSSMLAVAGAGFALIALGAKQAWEWQVRGRQLAWLVALVAAAIVVTLIAARTLG